MSEIGRVTIGVGYTVNTTASRTLSTSLKQLETTAASTTTTLDRLGSAASRTRTSFDQVTPAAEKLNSAKKRLSDLGVKLRSEIAKEVKELVELRDAFRDDEAAVAQLDRRISALNANMSGNVTRANQANNAIFQLSRGIEDLSFGFIGVANNIPITIEAMSRLRTEATAAGTTLLRSLGGALLGPAGLIAAFSTFTFVFLTFGDDIKRVLGNIGDSARRSAKAIKKDLEEILDFGDLFSDFGRSIETPDQVRKGLEVTRREITRSKSALEALNKEATRIGTAQQTIPGTFTQLLPALDVLDQLQTAEINRLRTLEQTLGLLEAQEKKLLDLTSISKILAELNIGVPDLPDTPLQPADRRAGSVIPIPTDIVLEEDIAKLFAGLKPIKIETELVKPTALEKFEQAMSGLQQRLGAGVVPEAAALREELQLLDTLFKGLVAEGIDPASQQFEEQRARMIELRDEVSQGRQSWREYVESLNSGQLALLAISSAVVDLGGAFTEVFANALLGVEKLKKGLKGLNGVLKKVLVRLAVTAAQAGLGALTGGGSFGTLFIQGLGFNRANIPRAASGGIFTRPTIAEIGEAGPEAVIPLDRLANVLNNAVAAIGPTVDMSRIDGLKTTMPTAFSSTVNERPRITEVQHRFAFDAVRISDRELLLLVRNAEKKETRNYGFN